MNNQNLEVGITKNLQAPYKSKHFAAKGFDSVPPFFVSTTVPCPPHISCRIRKNLRCAYNPAQSFIVTGTKKRSKTPATKQPQASLLLFQRGR